MSEQSEAGLAALTQQQMANGGGLGSVYSQQFIGGHMRQETKPEPVNESPTLGKLAAALAKAQGEMHPAIKGSENDAFKRNGKSSKFADFAAIWEAIRKPLASNELAVLQRVRTTKEGAYVTTMLIHSSGEWVRDTSFWPAVQPTSQSLGGAVTYGKRYSLSALVGVAADDDDDGNEATGKTPPATNGTDAVKGALSRQASASAKKAEPPKEATKPDSIPAPQTPEAMEAAMRFSSLWEKAKKAGYKSTEFQEFSARILGAKKPSSALTPDEVGQLESAWSAETLPAAKEK